MSKVQVKDGDRRGTSRVGPRRVRGSQKISIRMFTPQPAAPSLGNGPRARDLTHKMVTEAPSQTLHATGPKTPAKGSQMAALGDRNQDAPTIGSPNPLSTQGSLSHFEGTQRTQPSIEESEPGQTRGQEPQHTFSQTKQEN